MIHNYVRPLRGACTDSKRRRGDTCTFSEGRSPFRYDVSFIGVYGGGGGTVPLNACYVILIYIMNRASHSGGPGTDTEPGDELF
jgi:hypothetical protein